MNNAQDMYKIPGNNGNQQLDSGQGRWSLYGIWDVVKCRQEPAGDGGPDAPAGFLRKGCRGKTQARRPPAPFPFRIICGIGDHGPQQRNRGGIGHFGADIQHIDGDQAFLSGQVERNKEGA